jgi:hypothetical protein
MVYFCLSSICPRPTSTRSTCPARSCAAPHGLVAHPSLHSVQVFMRPITCSVRKSVHGTFLRIRSGQALTPVEHPIIFPMFREPDEQVAQLLQRSELSALSIAARGNPLPQFVKPVPNFGGSTTSKALISSRTQPLLGDSLFQLMDSLPHPTAHMKLADLLFESQFRSHSFIVRQFIVDDHGSCFAIPGYIRSLHE